MLLLRSGRGNSGEGTSMNEAMRSEGTFCYMVGAVFMRDDIPHIVAPREGQVSSYGQGLKLRFFLIDTFEEHLF